jgi:1-pyrroline-4-hydroxy-2-carboxylate deaminase
MVLRGETTFTHHFNEEDQLSASQKGFIEAQLRLFDAWYADWSRQPVARKYAA